MKVITCVCGQLLAVFSNTRCLYCKAHYNHEGKLLSKLTEATSPMPTPILTMPSDNTQPTQQGLWDVLLKFD